MTSILIIHNDPDFLVVEKPAGIPVQPQNRVLSLRKGFADGLNRRHKPSLVPPDSVVTLAQILAEKFPELKSVGGSDWGAVHRLDIETSGLVIFALNQKTYDYFRKQFSSNKIEKEYTALVEGKVSTSGKINWPIGSDPKSTKRVKVYKNKKEAVRNKAQEATTYYALTPNLSPAKGRGETTLLNIKIKTGRRHQIRAHLAALGYPIVGDLIYGSTISYGHGKKSVRLCLHAARLKFKHPRENHWVEVCSGQMP